MSTSDSRGPKAAGGRWGASDRRRFAVEVLMMVALAAVLFVGMNLLASKLLARFPWLRADLTEVRLHSLDPTTRDFLATTDPSMDVKVIFKGLARTRAAARLESQAFQSVVDLLGEYRLIAPGIEVEVIDVDREPRRAQLLAERLDLRNLRPDDISRVVLRKGERRIDLSMRQLVNLDYGDGRKPPRLIGIPAEQEITAALVALSEEEAPTIGFLVGQGGGRIDDAEATGFSIFAETLERIGFEARALDLAARSDVPSGMAAVVLPGLRSDLTEEELAALARYAEDGGRVLLLISPEVDAPRLDAWLDDFDFGLLEGDLVAVDRRQSHILQGWDQVQVSQGITAFHPITKPLARKGVRLYLGRTRPLVLERDDNTIRPVSLLKSGSQDRSESFVARLVEGRSLVGQLEFDPEIDVFTGAEMDYGFAVEKAGASGTARVAAVGCSSFLSNALILEGANQDFLVSAINWLVDREVAIELPSRSDLDRTIALTSENDRRILLLFVAGLPSLALAIGFGTWWRRRR